MELPGYKQSWIMAYANIKIKSITWTLYSSRQVLFFPMKTCSNVEFIFSCFDYCNTLYLAWLYRSTWYALGHSKLGTNWGSSLRAVSLNMFYGCSALAFQGFFSGFWLVHCSKNGRCRLSNPCLLERILFSLSCHSICVSIILHESN